jgi:methionyl-tRNA formyltransferase
VSGLSTVFLGTPEFAVPVLRQLAATPHRPRLVITPPDRPRGRGRRLASPPAAAAARELGIELLQTANVNEPEALARIRATEPDVAIVCAFGQLIREPLLSELELLNVHPSLLPRWRGAAPVERAIMAGDEQTGTTIMRLTAGLDSGPTALAEPVTIGEREDYGSLAVRLAELSGPLMVRALELHASEALTLTDQDDSAATYAEKIGPEDRRLDPSATAAELDRTVRALHPHIGAFIELEGGARLGVEAASPAPGATGIEPGRLAAIDAELRFGCADGALWLERVKPPGGRSMPADAYVRGHAVT